MGTQFASRYRAVTVAVINVLLVSLALLVIMGRQGLSARTIGASLLTLNFFVFGVGGVLFTGRAFFKWPAGQTAVFLRWERGFVIAAVLATVLGLALLEDMLHAAGDTVLARLGMITYLFGAVIVVVAETAYASRNEENYAQVIVYVVLAFLAQAAFGASLLQTGFVAAWAGWATVIWNVGWLLIMLIVRPNDIYFPVLHHVAPLIIGIALLVG